MYHFNTIVVFPLQMVSTVSVVMLYVIEIGCLLLSVLGVFGAFKEKRWCFILVKVCLCCCCACGSNLCQITKLDSFIILVFDFVHLISLSLKLSLIFVCVQYAAGMAAASQTIIVKAALSYQDIYEV